MNIYTPDQAESMSRVFEILSDNWPVLACVAVFMLALTLSANYMTKQNSSEDDAAPNS